MRIIEAAKTFRPGGSGGVRHKLRRVAGQEVHIPFECCLEAWIERGSNTRIPQIEDPQVQAGMLGEPPKPRAIIMRRMGDHDGKALHRNVVAGFDGHAGLGNGQALTPGARQRAFS